jgi:hypothetical protein
MKIIFYDRLPKPLLNKIEKIGSLICMLEEEPQSQKELLDSCHSQFLEVALKKGGSIIVIDPREIRSIGGRGGCFIDAIGTTACPENIYMYGTLYRYK